MLTLGSVGEFGFIDLVKPDSVSKDLKLGIGDDAAIISPPQGFDVVVTADMLCEDTHFFSDTEPFAIGWRSMCANISDIAAMGAIPRFYFVSLGIDPERDLEYAKDIYRGFSELGGKYDVCLAGGDTIKHDKTVVSVCVMGYVERTAALKRSGKIYEGDLIVYVGPLGQSAAGLAVIKNRLEGFESESKAFLYPEPQVLAGRSIAMSGYARVMMDNSDGLSSCLEDLVLKNNMGVLVFEEAIFDDSLNSIAMQNGLDYLDFVFSGGEDFGLVAVIDRGFDLSFLKKTSSQVRVIGEVIGSKEIVMKRIDGTIFSINREGYKQF